MNIFERLAKVTINGVVNLQAFNIPNPEPEHLNPETEIDPNNKALFTTIQKLRLKVLAVWNAIEALEAVSKLSPTSNFMPWSRLLFAKFVTLKGNVEDLYKVS